MVRTAPTVFLAPPYQSKPHQAEAHMPQARILYKADTTNAPGKAGSLDKADGKKIRLSSFQTMHITGITCLPGGEDLVNEVCLKAPVQVVQAEVDDAGGHRLSCQADIRGVVARPWPCGHRKARGRCRPRVDSATSACPRTRTPP